MNTTDISLYELQYMEQALEKEQCERSYYQFFLRAYKVLEPEDELQDNWHIKYLCDLLQQEAERVIRKEKKKHDLIINIPPRTLKSKIVTVCWNAWVWTKAPHIKFITASYSATLSTEHSVLTRNLIQSNWYSSIWGSRFSLLEDQNTKQNFMTSASGSRVATSVGGSVTGKGADIIIADDPINPEDAESEIERKNCADWWSRTMLSRLNNQSVGLRVVVMQRLHEEDLTGVLLSKQANYEHICIPITASDNVKPKILKKNYSNKLFFGDRFGQIDIDAMKKELGSRIFAGQYEQRPAPAEGALFKKNWFNKRFVKSDLPPNTAKYYFSDTAYGKQSSDNSATICFSVVEQNIYIHAIRTVNLPFTEFIKDHIKFLEQTGYTKDSRDYIEPKASGISTVQALQKCTIQGKFLNVLESNPPTDSKKTRANSQTVKLESGRVYFAYHMEELVEEALLFPYGKHDDRVDALISVCELADTLGSNGMYIPNNIMIGFGNQHAYQRMLDSIPRRS
jgi:predicted phage terminase large subunit-like protein